MRSAEAVVVGARVAATPSAPEDRVEVVLRDPLTVPRAPPKAAALSLAALLLQGLNRPAACSDERQDKRRGSSPTRDAQRLPPTWGNWKTDKE